MLKQVENHFKGYTKNLNELRVSYLIVYFRNKLANFGVRKSFSLGRGGELSLHKEMNRLTFAPALDPTALERPYEQSDAVLWPKVMSLFLIQDEAYFHFYHSFFQLRDFMQITPYWSK